MFDLCLTKADSDTVKQILAGSLTSSPASRRSSSTGKRESWKSFRKSLTRTKKPQTSQVSMPDMSSESLLSHLDYEDFREQFEGLLVVIIVALWTVFRRNWNSLKIRRNKWKKWVQKQSGNCCSSTDNQVHFPRWRVTTTWLITIESIPTQTIEQPSLLFGTPEIEKDHSQGDDLPENCTDLSIDCLGCYAYKRARLAIVVTCHRAMQQASW